MRTSYDPKRYRIAPWRGRYGDQTHALRLHPHVDDIRRQIVAKKKQIVRLDEQIHQLEQLERRAAGIVIDGVLVREPNGPPGSKWYAITLVDDHVHRSAKIYPNAHNGGKTFGYHIYMDRYPFHRHEWRGTGHTYEQAVEGARAWVLRAERQPFRAERLDGTIREEFAR